MEVHHHPHIGKKKFKEYFLEFLMIFLAVSLGFFAENIREKIVENKKEHHYIQNLVADLKKDTVDVNLALYFQKLISKKIDSSLRIPVDRLKNISSQDTFYHHFLFYYTFTHVFYQNNNTIAQLKTAGGFSVIKKENVIDSISDLSNFYDRYVKLNGDYYITASWDVIHAAQPIMVLMDEPFDADDSVLTVIPKNIQLFTSLDKTQIQKLYNTIVAEQGNLMGYVILEKEYKRKAKRLINYLKKEYHMSEKTPLEN